MFFIILNIFAFNANGDDQISFDVSEIEILDGGNKIIGSKRGNITTNNIVLNGSDLVFEGYLANAYETTLRVVEPTADNIVRLPNVSGDVITTGNLTKDGTATGDPLAAEGDAVAFAIALGG